MKTSTLFVLGLATGGLAVFGVRAASLGEPSPPPQHESSPQEDPEAEEPHAGHTAAARPARADETVEAGGKPENEICPVMGNPVDPEVYVDYQGRRIGFCCPGCDAVFLEDPETYLKKVDAELRKRGQK